MGKGLTGLSANAITGRRRRKPVSASIDTHTHRSDRVDQIRRRPAGCAGQDSSGSAGRIEGLARTIRLGIAAEYGRILRRNTAFKLEVIDRTRARCSSKPSARNTARTTRRCLVRSTADLGQSTPRTSRDRLVRIRTTLGRKLQIAHRIWRKVVLASRQRITPTSAVEVLRHDDVAGDLNRLNTVVVAVEVLLSWTDVDVRQAVREVRAVVQGRGADLRSGGFGPPGLRYEHQGGEYQGGEHDSAERIAGAREDAHCVTTFFSLGGKTSARAPRQQGRSLGLRTQVQAENLPQIDESLAESSGQTTRRQPRKRVTPFSNSLYEISGGVFT